MKQSDLQASVPPEKADANQMKGGAPVPVTTAANDAEPAGPDLGGSGQDCDGGEDGRQARIDGGLPVVEQKQN